MGDLGDLGDWGDEWTEVEVEEVAVPPSPPRPPRPPPRPVPSHDGALRPVRLSSSPLLGLLLEVLVRLRNHARPMQPQ